MKTNVLIGFAVTILLTATIFSSCKKEDEKVKGCMDPSSLSYNSSAEEDDGSCVYPSDKIIGSWNVAETVSGNTVNYTSTISRTDDNNVTISSTRSNPPVYYMNNLLVTVNWKDNKIVKTGTTVSGTITNENDFRINYVYGSSSAVYSVSQHYTR